MICLEKKRSMFPVMLYWLVIIAKSVMDGIAYPLYVGMINMQHLLGITVVHEKHHLTPTVEFYGS